MGALIRNWRPKEMPNLSALYMRLNKKRQVWEVTKVYGQTEGK